MNLVDRRTYRAKHPMCVNGFVNDRTIVYLSSLGNEVHYDGPTISRGHKRPVVTRAKFETWASHDVTEQLPAGCYETWDHYRMSKNNKKLGIG